VEVDVEGPENAVPAEHAGRDRPDHVELVGVVRAQPVVEAEVPHDELLPARLVCLPGMGKAVGRGHRRRKAFTPGGVHGRREHH
jgi:hypothetical protein